MCIRDSARRVPFVQGFFDRLEEGRMVQEGRCGPVREDNDVFEERNCFMVRSPGRGQPAESVGHSVI
eukprot:163925-Heterocapsa_arctica.AAC.1